MRDIYRVCAIAYNSLSVVRNCKLLDTKETVPNDASAYIGHSLLFGVCFCCLCLETVELFSLEVHDVSIVAVAVALCHAHIDVGRLLEEFGGASGIVEDEQ